MREALRLAAAAAECGEVPVGAVIVQDGEILAKGFNEVETRQDALAHAEIQAIRGAQDRLKSWRLLNTTLYVTKEPCPMCAGALLHTRVDRIVFGVTDPKAGACGGAFNLFELPGINHRCALEPGVMKEESLALLQSFFKERRAR